MQILAIVSFNGTTQLVKLIVLQVTKSKLMRQLAVSKLAQRLANTLEVALRKLTQW